MGSIDAGFMKRDTKATLDFSSIAKGYAVDIAADSLDDLGLEHFMLEVGGEIRFVARVLVAMLGAWP